MDSKSIDLSKLFGTVAKTMVQNKTTLNEADTYNHDHGDNMVQIFEVITQAMKEKKTATPAEQLAYASQLLSKKSQSGSAKLYAEGLTNASSQFQGVNKVTPDNAMTLIQTLLGAQPQAAPASTPSAGTGMDLLGSLLGGQSSQSAPTQSAGGGMDLIGSLLGGLSGTDSSQSQQQQGSGSGVDLGQLLNAGMAFAQAKQAGGSNLDAILKAVVSSSKMGASEHRSQSGTLVANTLMQAVGKMMTGSRR